MKSFQLALFIGQNYPAQLMVSGIARVLKERGHGIRIFIADKKYPAYEPTILGTIDYLINSILYQDVFTFLSENGYVDNAKCLTPHQLSQDFEVNFVTREQLNSDEMIEGLGGIDGGISLCFPFIFKPKIIRHLRTKNNLLWNVHSATLPEYPGLGGLKWAMYDEQTHASSTLHEINEGIDTGDIIATRPQPLDYTVDYYSNWLALVSNSIEMVLSAIEKLSLGQSLSMVPNDKSKMKRYFRRTTIEDVELMHSKGIRFFDIDRLQKHYLESFSERETAHEKDLADFLKKLFGKMNTDLIP